MWGLSPGQVTITPESSEAGLTLTPSNDVPGTPNVIFDTADLIIPRSQAQLRALKLEIKTSIPDSPGGDNRRAHRT